GGVGRHEGPGPDGDVGGDEDDVAPPPLDHRGDERPDDTVDADEVDVDLPREALGRDVDGRAGRDQAGVADDDLDVAEVGGRLRGELGHRRVVGDVEGVRDRFATAHA